MSFSLDVNITLRMAFTLRIPKSGILDNVRSCETVDSVTTEVAQAYSVCSEIIAFREKMPMSSNFCESAVHLCEKLDPPLARPSGISSSNAVNHGFTGDDRDFILYADTRTHCVLPRQCPPSLEISASQSLSFSYVTHAVLEIPSGCRKSSIAMILFHSSIFVPAA